MSKISGESMWLVISLVLIIAIMIIIFMLLSGLGPGGVFDLFQGIMATIALYLITQLHGVLR